MTKSKPYARAMPFSRPPGRRRPLGARGQRVRLCGGPADGVGHARTVTPMALPIIVPAWDFDPQSRFQSAHALPSKRLASRSVRIPQPLDAAGGSTREPCERELLILRWRCSAKVWPSTPPCWKVGASVYRPQVNDREPPDLWGQLVGHFRKAFAQTTSSGVGAAVPCGSITGPCIGQPIQKGLPDHFCF